MNLQDQIKLLELKFIASRKDAEDQLKVLEALRDKAANPAPAVRRNLKAQRIQDIANFYHQMKLKKSSNQISRQ